VVDAAILVAAARGRSSEAVLEVSRSTSLVVTDRAIDEARRRITLGLKRPELNAILDSMVAEMTVTSVATLIEVLPIAELTLMEAVPSRGGSGTDAHVLAAAWSVNGDIWSTDRDFSGTGVASWSTPNLIRALPSDVS
jgi:predicted nucleic acid-binding protein